MDIHTDKLFRFLRSVRGMLEMRAWNQGCREDERAGNDGMQEFHHLFGGVSGGEVEIQTIGGLLDVDSILMSAMLQNDLLKEEESSLVGDLLANLNGGYTCR